MQYYICKLFIVLLAFTYVDISHAAHLKLVAVEFPPLHYADSKGQAVGAAVDVVSEVLKKTGHSFEITVMPWTRAISFCREGVADAMFTVYQLPDLQAILDFSSEIFIPHVISIYTTKSRNKNFSGNPADLATGTIGTVNAISYGERFDKLKDRLKLERVESLDLNFKMLNAGRIDYVVSNRYSAEFSIRSLGIEASIFELHPPIDVLFSYFAFSKKSQSKNILPQFDKALQEFKKSPDFDLIMARHRIQLPKN